MEDGIEAFSPSQLSTLNEIALKCAYEIGQPVYTARSILYTLGGPSPLDYSEHCGQVESREKRESPIKEVFISPNPSTGAIFLSSKQVLDTATIIIYDASGLQVYYEKELNLDSQKSKKIILNKSGLYFISIESSDFSQVSKCVILD